MSRDKGIAKEFYVYPSGELICRTCGGSNWDGDVYDSVGDDVTYCIKCAIKEKK